MNTYHEYRAPQGEPADGERDVWMEDGEVKFGHWDGSAWVVDRVISSVDVTTEPIVDFGTDALAAEDWIEFLPYTSYMNVDLYGYIDSPCWENYSAENPVRFRRLTNGRVEIRGELVSNTTVQGALVLLKGSHHPQYQDNIGETDTLKYYNGSTWLTPSVYVTVDGDVTTGVSGAGAGARIQFSGFTFAL